MKTPKEAKEVFQELFEGRKNIMTPDIIRYGWRNHLAYELSEGTDMDNNAIFGVTVIDTSGTELDHDHNKSKLCKSLDEAKQYIRGLK